MRTQLIQRSLLGLGLATVLLACLDEPNYSDVPTIRLVGPPTKVTLEPGILVGQSRRDSVIVTIGFQDGTGDLGEDTRDTTRQRLIFGKEPWGNYEIRTFQFLNGTFTELPQGDNKKLFFPRLTREGQRGPIEGDLDFSQVFPYQRPFRMVPVKFQIRIRDRGLQVSNIIETDTISVPLNAR